MTHEERMAMMERIIKQQFFHIIAQAVEEYKIIVATKDQMFNNAVMYTEYAGVVNGASVDFGMTDAMYWDIVKRMAAEQDGLVASDEDIRIADDFDFDKYLKI